MSALAFALVALVPRRAGAGTAGARTWPLRAPRAAHGAVAGDRAGGRAVGVQRRTRDRQQALRARSRRPADRHDHQRDRRRSGWPLWIALRRRVRADPRRRCAAGRRGRAGRHRHPAPTRPPPDGRRSARHVARPAPDVRTRPSGLRILDVAQPLAYCLPGVRSRVVVSEGTLDHLWRTARSPRSSATSAPTCAPVTTWCSRCSPRCTPHSRGSSAAPTRSTPCGCSSRLLADDAAVRAAGPTPLARALVACARAARPSGALAAGGPTTVMRVRRLGGGPTACCSRRPRISRRPRSLVVPTVASRYPG